MRKSVCIIVRPQRSFTQINMCNIGSNRQNKIKKQIIIDKIIELLNITKYVIKRFSF